MNTIDPIYITGHLHPDTDSIASAIAYSFFKRVPSREAQRGIFLSPETFRL